MFIHEPQQTAVSRIYATVDLGKARVARTSMIENEPSNPRWDESFWIYCAHMISEIVFTVKDANPVGATLIGRAYLPVEDIINGIPVDRWIEIMDKDKTPIYGKSKIHVRLQFSSVNEDSEWSKGISDLAFKGIPRTFFRERQGCHVTLYQDAHVAEKFAEFLESRFEYKPQRCWEDIFNAINNAKHFIYITGWSVYINITLTRDPERPKQETLGELLKRKAEDGVRVLLLVWDDITSVELDYFRKDGLMATHDQETGDFFRNTKVHCVLCPRNPDDENSVIQRFEVTTIFTHHQKTVIVDFEGSGAEPDKRTIVSFLGGIDLCDGRYDTNEHPLFRTLNTVHRDDFHQPNFPGSSITKGGPREPWHDVHCRVEGPAAWDVLYNFEQRWQRQAGKGNNLLFSVSELETFTGRPSPATSSEDPETWNVQVFRSIDDSAVYGFPKNPEKAATVGLVSGKDNIIDRSIQDAYIHAIRRAKNFIYIENQYFIGSSYGWKDSDIKVENINALHLIPKELSLKIVSKIAAGERFTVYVVIPMWPEGIPESVSVQAILYWQRRTMEMMYKDIALALHAKGETDVALKLRDYLTFFCLGNREAKEVGEYDPPEKPAPETDYARAQQARRFMIYVHAKTMIGNKIYHLNVVYFILILVFHLMILLLNQYYSTVDDEYIIVGSANINQRSMDGARDTEIAMGGYQPHHLAGEQQPARGSIFRFRMALWLEHLEVYNSIFYNPETLECVRKVNSIADENWQHYSSNTFPENGYLAGHLLRYPVGIASDGAISVPHGFNFPDTNASVLGNRSRFLRPDLTT